MPVHRVVMNKGSYATNLAKIVMPNGHEYFVDPFLGIIKNTMYGDDIRTFDELGPEELAILHQHGLQRKPNATVNSVNTSLNELTQFIRTEIKKCLEEKLHGTN